MVEDDVLQQVRAAREAYAEAHGFDVRAMVADLRARDAAGDWRVVRLPPRRPGPAQEPTAAPNGGPGAWNGSGAEQ
jgi:hypothetical protein